MIGRLQASAANAWSARRGEILGVAALLALVGAYYAVQALRIDTYALLVDELLYTKAAQGYADNPFRATVFSEPYAVPNQLYPRFLALPYLLLSSLNAFKAAHVMNALLFASTLIPVYLLSRRLGAGPRWSLVAGALAVVVPWSVATFALMAESLAYPVFAWGVLIGVVAIADPRPRNDVLLIAAALSMVYARTQFLIVVAAIAAALVLHELAWPGGGRAELLARARAHWVLGGAVVAGLFVALVIRPDFLGNYANTIDYPRFPTLVLDSMADHFAHIAWGVGVIPVLVWICSVVRGGSEPASRAEHAFAYVSGLTVLAVIYQSGFFSRQIAGGELQERYAFYVAALFAVGTALMLARPPRRAPVGSLLAGAALVVLLVATAFFPDDRVGVRVILSASSKFNGPLTDIAQAISSSWTVPGALAVVAGLLAVVVAAAFAVHRAALPALAALVLGFGAFQTNFVLSRTVAEVNGAIPGVLGHPPKAWVDGLVYQTDDEAGVIEGDLQTYTEQKWLWTQFWNERVTRIYALPGVGAASGLPTTPLDPDPATGRIATSPELPLLVVAADEPRLGVRGEVVRTIVNGQQLIRPERPYRATWLYGEGGGRGIGREPTALSVYPPSDSGGSARIVFEIQGPVEDADPEGAAAAEEAQWVVASEDDRITGRGPREVALSVRVEPGESRGVVSLSAPEASEKVQLQIARLRVDWTD